MILQRLGRVGAYFLLLATLTACGPKRIETDRSVWDDRDSPIGIAVVLPASGSAVKAGAQGLLDTAINEAMAGDLNAHLKQLNFAEFQNFATTVQTALSQRGYKTVVVPQPLNLAQFPDYPAPDNTPLTFERKDLRGLGQQYGVGRLLVFELGPVGTIRSYYGFVPISAPAGFAALLGRWVDLRDNHLLWQSSLSQQAAVQGDWDEPPSYPNIDRATAAAIAAVQDAALQSLFATAPTGAGLSIPAPTTVMAAAPAAPAAVTSSAPVVAPPPAPVPAEVAVPPAALKVGGRAVAQATAIPRLRPTPDGLPATPVPLQGTDAELLADQRNASGRWWYVRVGGVTGWLPESTLQAR